MVRNSILCLALLLACGVGAQHGTEKTEPGHTMFMGDDFKWLPGPKSLPPGTFMAILEGDPAKEGMFTIRVKVPANFTVPPHWHPADEHVTVIAGTFYMAPLSTIDRSKAKGMKAGGFALMMTGQRHFALTKDDGAIVQLHGVGPWQVNYVNPADDPRNKGG